ncbi:hypothetical protein ACIBEF_23195 [Micromonospora sp. NPDC050795]|uniref:hypothetical protein n=1 Tax=Micromonospora sp. NPDC050795 TaxID=3364282 RepID=UPI0037A00FFB
MLLSTACSPGEPAESAPTTQPITPATTTSLGPNAVAEKEAVTAYQGMWDAFVEAAKVSDPDAPDVRRYASGQALRLIVNALYTNREQREVILGELVLDPKVTNLAPAGNPVKVTVLDCVNDEKWLEHKASGGLANDEPGGKHRTTATVEQTAEGWRVSSFILDKAGTC